MSKPCDHQQGSASVPLISVLLPVFNGQDHLLEAVQSILNQSIADFELLLIDDGSTDRTQEICKSIKDERLRYIYKDNSGLVDALNMGLGAATGRYIARMDADDISFPDRFRQQIEYMEFSGVKACSGGFISINKEGYSIDHYVPTDVRFCNEWWLPAKEPYLPHPFLMVETEITREVGGYRHVLFAEDADLYWRLLTKYPIANIQEYIGKYRVHNNSVSGKTERNGRVQAVFSQAAAISHQRIAGGKSDLSFSIDISAATKVADFLEGVTRLFESQLDITEYSHLCAASGLKLMEFSKWRPYKLRMHDIDFTRYHLNRLEYVNEFNRQEAEDLILDRVNYLKLNKNS